MERRINKKIEEHHSDLINKIKTVISIPEIHSSQGQETKLISQLEQLCTIINSSTPCTIDKKDFAKRKRIKNVVDLADRCCACRANGEQCTRRRKDGSQFCGTHIKGTPNGITNENPHTNLIQTKKEVWAQEVQGIIYYLDKDNNVYKAEDIMANKVNPEIICKWALKENNSYEIVQL